MCKIFPESETVPSGGRSGSNGFTRSGKLTADPDTMWTLLWQLKKYGTGQSGIKSLKLKNINIFF